MALNEDTVHLLLFWEHPSSPGANTSRGCQAARFTDREGRVSERSTPCLASRPQPGGEGRPGERGGRRAAPGRWAATRDELSPAGCCPQVASDAARGPRPRLEPRGAFRAKRPPPAGPGPISREQPARPRPPPPPLSRPPTAAPLPAPPARPPPGGLHTERPRAARPDPTRPDPGLPARESARRSDDYETGCLRPFRRRGHRLPLLAGTARAAAASTTNESTGLRATHSSLATGSATSQSQAV